MEPARFNAARVHQIVRDARRARLRFVGARPARGIDDDVAHRSRLVLQLNDVIVEPCLLVIARDVVVLVELVRPGQDFRDDRATGWTRHSIAAHVYTGGNTLAAGASRIDGNSWGSLAADDPAG